MRYFLFSVLTALLVGAHSVVAATTNPLAALEAPLTEAIRRDYATALAGMTETQAVVALDLAASLRALAARHLPCGLTEAADSFSLTLDGVAGKCARLAYGRTNGVAHAFAALQTASAVLPVYWVATGWSSCADASATQAAAFLHRVVMATPATTAAQSQLSLSRTPLDASARITGTLTGRAYAMPFPCAFVAFIDDQPLANWGHPCRLVFIKDDLTAFVVWYVDEPMTVTAAGKILTLDTLTAQTAQTSPRLSQIRAAVNDLTTSTRPACRNGDTAHTYAVLISGGYNVNNNHTRYWGDMAAMYGVLTRCYGVPRDHIQVYMSDGTSSSADVSTSTSSHSYFPDNSSPLDLDGDGTADVTGAATTDNLTACFSALKSQLTADDQLFVFITDHGSKSSSYFSSKRYLCLWNATTISVSDFAALTKGIAAPIVFAFEFCYSGAFISTLANQGGVRVVATAASNESSSAWGRTSRVTGYTSTQGLPYMNPWVYYFVGAISGRFPSVSLSPWTDDVACNAADTSGDGVVSIREASDYAAKCITADNYSETPTYGESSSGVGDALYLVKGTPSQGAGALSHIAICGPQLSEQGQDFTCAAYADDGTSAAIPPVWSVDETTYAAIDDTGRLTLKSGFSGEIVLTVRARYEQDGRVAVTAWKTRVTPPSTVADVESVTTTTDATGATIYCVKLATSTATFDVSAETLAAAGIATSGDVAATLMATGANGAPRYQSLLLGLAPESDVPAAEQLKTTVTMVDGVPVVSCSPRSDSTHVTYDVLGKAAVGDASWRLVTDANRDAMHFFRIRATVK